jgi:ABC-type glycerol-3-phosphate transport system substrate-binding protein
MERFLAKWIAVILCAIFIVPIALAQQKELTIWPGGLYTPSRLLPGTATRERKGFDPIVEKYQKLHPDVKINYVKQPMGEVRTWLVTQLTGGTAPDICWTQPDYVNEDIGKGWWLNLDPYLEKPNPYVKGNKRWYDIFYPGPLEVWRAADGHLYMLLGDQVQVGFYYNKNIFRKYGLSVPKNWASLMEIAKKLKNNNVVAFAMENSDLHQVTWISGWLTNFYFWPEIEKYDKDGNRWISKIEIAEAIKKGTFSYTSERGIARLKTLKEMYDYAQKGFVSADQNLARRLFVTGQTAMLVLGSWIYLDIQNDPLRKFDFGVFYFPVLDSKTSPLIPDGIPPTNKAAGYGSFQLAVTNSAMKSNKVDLSIDFLMFATAPQNAGPVIKETGTALPAIKGCTPNPALKPFAESISYPAAPFQEDDSLLDNEFGEKFLAVANLFLSGAISVEEGAQRLQKYAEEAADRVLALIKK